MKILKSILKRYNSKTKGNGALIILLPLVFFYLLASLNLTELTDHQWQDNLFRLRYALFGREPTSPFIIHGALTNQALAQKSPTDRSLYARLAAVLDKAGARDIAFDLFFRETPVPGDEELVQAAQASGKLFFPLVLYEESFPEGDIKSKEELSDHLILQPHHNNRSASPFQAKTILAPFNQLRGQAKGLGHINMHPESDGVIRSVPLVYDYQGAYIPSLPLRVLMDYLDIKKEAIEISFGKDLLLKAARFPGGMKKDITIPLDHTGSTRLNFIGPYEDSFYEFSAENILKAENDSRQLIKLRDQIEGAMVLISDILVRSKDKSTGVFNAVYPNSELHTNLMNMVMTDRFIHPMPLWGSFALSLIMAAWLWIASLSLGNRGFYLGALALIAAYILCAFLAFFGFRIIMPLFPVLMSFGGALFGAGIFRHYLLTKESLHYKMEKQKAREVLESKNRFFRYITHDLKNPLMPIKGLLPSILSYFENDSEILKDKHLKIEDKLLLMQRSAQKLEDYIEELLELARIEAGISSPRFVQENIVDFVFKTGEFFRLPMEQKTITLEFDSSQEDIQVCFDKGQLEKVLFNLLSNALKFCPSHSTVTVTISGPFDYSSNYYPWNGDRPRPRKIIGICVKDSGPGISPNEAEHIFEPFFQGNKTKALGGTGIGLSLAAEYIKLHYGAIMVNTKPGQGSEFMIYLPEGSSHLNPEEKAAALKAENSAKHDKQQADQPQPRQAVIQKNLKLYPPQPVLLVDDNPDILATYSQGLGEYGFNHFILEQDSRNIDGLLAQNREISVCLLDLNMPHVSGLSLLKTIHEDYPHIPVIITSAMKNSETVVHCMKQGAFDYLEKPIDLSALAGSLRHCLKIQELKNEQGGLARSLVSNSPKLEAFSKIKTRNPEMFKIFNLLNTMAPFDEPVLLLGESGTGKELLAEAIHSASSRQGKYVTMNIAGLDDQFFTDTLFGHKKGAFNEALKDREGLVKTAQDGTLFLDEIGDMSGESQVKLLRLLESGEYYPLGADKPDHSSARIIAATNADLQNKVEQGLFRNDLYNRLSVIEIIIPPLRQRPEDLALLLEFFMEQTCRKFGRKNQGYKPEVLGLLKNYSFPGNIRELKHMLVSAIGRHREHGPLGPGFFKEYLKKQPRQNINLQSAMAQENFYYSGAFPTLESMENILVKEALKRKKHQKDAAELLGIDRFKLGRKLGKYGNKDKQT
ncbi:MAG: sigma 54-interacting transcriptional regulator [Spirochaetales bacterium]|nr:sigma 54-interacting transcriptional regulator [Spirochaetales bacterium]